MIPGLRTVGKEQMGSRVLLSAGCEVTDDTSDVFSCGHQDVDSLE